MTRFDRTRTKTGRTRSLRVNVTDCERLVWSRLRSAQIEQTSFRRQHPVGPYVLDFYCSSLALAIELDGSQHAEKQQAFADKRRDAFLESRGILVLRFWDSDVTENLDGVLEKVRQTVLERRT